MGEQSKVHVHSRLTAVSSRPVGTSKTHQLTSLDHAMRLHTLQLIFYYEKNPFGSFDVGPFRVSLSETLSLYPPVTGRLARRESGNWEVNCNDAGIRVLKAKVDVKFEEWLKSGGGLEERSLGAWEDMPDNPCTWSPFRVQISEFEGGGAAIALSCNHMQADITTLTLLFKSWTEAHRQQAISHPPVFSSPLGGRSAPNITTKSTCYYATKSRAQVSSVKMATATFRFSDSVIKQYLSDIHGNCADATPFDLLAALFWTHIARLKAPKHNHKHSLSVCVDFRRLLKEPLGYFGNALHFSLLSLDEQDIISGELGKVAGLVHDFVSGLEEEEFLSVIDWFESQKGEGGKYAPPFRMYGPELTCVSLEHMISGNQSLMYAATFEDNLKPAHVSVHIGNSEGEGVIMVMASPEGGLSRTVIVMLPQEEMSQLCEDQDILCLKPEMLLRGEQ